MLLRRVVSLLIATCGLVGATACAPPPAPTPSATPPQAAAPSGPHLHLALTALTTTNVERTAIDATVETWPRGGAGPVLYATESHGGGPQPSACVPNVTLMFAAVPAPGDAQRVGDDAQIFIEAHCGSAGEIRSWRGVDGTVTTQQEASGTRVHVTGVTMEPSCDDTKGEGRYVVDGVFTNLAL